jgi:hypothetical protein
MVVKGANAPTVAFPIKTQHLVGDVPVTVWETSLFAKASGGSGDDAVVHLIGLRVTVRETDASGTEAGVKVEVLDKAGAVRWTEQVGVNAAIPRNRGLAPIPLAGGFGLKVYSNGVTPLFEVMAEYDLAPGS